MWRKTKKRLAAAGAELAQIGESAQIFDLVRPDVEQNHVRSLEPHLGRRDEQDSHRRGVGENFRPIEDLVVQGNRERAETEIAGSLKQLMGGIIEMIFRIVERVDMEIDLDPIASCASSRSRSLIRGLFICASLNAASAPCSNFFGGTSMASVRLPGSLHFAGRLRSQVHRAGLECSSRSQPPVGERSARRVQLLLAFPRS